MCPILDDMENAAYKLGELGKKVAAQAADKFQDIKPAVEDAVGKVKPAVEGAMGKVKPAVEDAMGKVKPVVEDVIGTVLSKAGELGDKVEAAVQEHTQDDKKKTSIEEELDKEVKDRLGKIRAAEFDSDMITDMFKKKDDEK